MKYDAIVIGAGSNGLTAATTLAKRGRKVLVLEAAEAIGGRTRAIAFAPGFRSPLTEDCGAIPRTFWAKHDFRALTKPASMNVLDAAGQLHEVKNTMTHGKEAVARFAPADAEKWFAFHARMKQFARVLERLYLLAPPDIDDLPVGELLPLASLALRVRALGRADMTEFLRVMPMSIRDLMDDTFENETLKATVAASAIRDLRQGPWSGGTTFNLLHHMVGSLALTSRPWFVAGPDAFAVEAAGALKAGDGEIRTGARVERITVHDGAVTGVALAGGDEIAAPLVISTADPKRTLLGMLDQAWLDPEFAHAVANIRMRGCAAFVLYGVNGVLGDDQKHLTSSVSLTPSVNALERAADAAKYGKVSADPHVEFFSPSLRWPTFAPAGKHVIAARVQYAPYHLKDGVWDQARKAALETYVRVAIGRVLPQFATSVEHAVVLSPVDIEERFNVTEGALTHGEIALDQILFMRPVAGWGRYAMPIDGLFLGGSGAHPGPGILGGAGLLAARAALRK